MLIMHNYDVHIVYEIVILYVDYIEKVTGTRTDKLVAVLQDCDRSNGTAIKQFLITGILFDPQITMV